MHAHEFAIHGYFDWRLLATAAYLCRRGDTAVEVGANVGTETIGLADIVGTHGHVYAFEPEPCNAEQLRLAMRSAGLAQVEIIQSAVSDTTEPVTFVPSSNERESGSGHIGACIQNPDECGLTVESLTLDSYLLDKGPVRLLVIDAEGAELHILRGCREILRRDRPAVIVEAQEDTLRRFGFGLLELHAELNAHGYQVYELARFGLGTVEVENTARIRNWLALPPDRAHEARKIHYHLLRCGLFPCIRGLNPLTRRFA